MNPFSLTPSAWTLAGVLLLTVYLCVILFRQGLRFRGDLRAVFMVAAMFLLPVLLVTFSVYGGRNLLDVFDRELLMNQDTANWWVMHIVPEKGPPWQLNLITTGIVLSVFYIVVTLLIALISSYYAKKKGVEFLSIHKALLKWVIVLVGCAIILKIKPWPLLLGMGAASIVLGFALKEMLENLFTGMTLDMEGAFHRGDWIRVGDSDTIGKVYEKNWRATRIITLNHESITIPNRMLGSEKIVCFNKPHQWFAHTLQVGTSYNDPPVKVKEILRTILMRHPNIIKNPAPDLRTIAYDDFSINYEMKFWIMDYAKLLRTIDEVMTQIWYAFKFYGVEIPFPIRTVHFKDREQLREEKADIEQDVNDNREFLLELPFLNKHLSYKDIDFLAKNAFKRGFFPDEHIVQRGEFGDSLYIVMDGEARVVMPDGRRVELKPGKYFGEMGLLGGRRRTADVIAGSNGARVLRIDKYCMDILFRNYPELLQETQRLRDIRKEELPSEKRKVAAGKKHPVKRVGKFLVEFLRPW
jgi:small-conductance mechanosensitive channel